MEYVKQVSASFDASSLECDSDLVEHNGGFYVVNTEAIAERVNDIVAARVEYEETHKDAGDAFSHMLSEAWVDANTARLVDWLKECEDLPAWQHIDPDTLAEMALDRFRMAPDSIHAPGGDGDHMLACYPLQEIEIQITEGEIEGIPLWTLKHCGSIEALVGSVGNKTALLYVGTDAAWSAVLDKEEMVEAINEHNESEKEG